VAFEPDRVRKGMGGPAAPTAEFYRLHAMLHERLGTRFAGTTMASEKRIEACVLCGREAEAAHLAREAQATCATPGGAAILDLAGWLAM
jgi:hypothetical protein